MRRLALLLALLAAPAAAQIAPGRETLIEAARVEITPEGRLTASGGVEVASGDTRLSAAAILYDRGANRVVVTGPIRLTDGGGTVLLADGADLDADLREGLLTGLRLLVEGELQIAAAELRRTGPRFDALTSAVASSCRVCAANPVPLWEIRARRVVHDRAERLIYFSGAQFRVRGLPVAYLPRLRLPAPGNDRAQGLLRPAVRTTSQLGTGLKLPYFVPLGPTRDVTLTPYLAPGTRTLELRFRQAYRPGDVRIDAALSRDDILDGGRGYAFATGDFLLGATRLSFDLEEVSDDAYLVDYGITDRDLIRREVRLARVDANRLAEARLAEYERLRDDTRDETAPNRQAEARWLRRFPGLLGGIAFAEGRVLTYERRSDRPVDGPADADALPDGRDATRVAAAVGWRARAVAASGVEARALARLDLGAYAVSDDAAFPDPVARAVPTMAARLAWPLRRPAAGHATDLLEPAVQVLWRGDPGRVPLEEGTRPEFDSGNLFAPSRLPGADGDPGSLRADLALGWTRLGPGYEMGVLVGRSLRAEDADVFAPGTGLSGTSSDWLVEARAETARLRADARALVGASGDLTRAEARLAHAGARTELGAGYVYQSAATHSDGLPRARVSELDLAGAARLRRGLDADMGLRYDFDARRTRTAALGLTVEGDCARARLSAERRFSAGAGLSPETRFGLTVELTGIGGAPRRGAGACG